MGCPFDDFNIIFGNLKAKSDGKKNEKKKKEKAKKEKPEEETKPRSCKRKEEAAVEAPVAGFNRFVQEGQALRPWASVLLYQQSLNVP